MAFPVVQTRNETSFTAAATSFACNLPASIAAGDLLIVILASGGTNAQQFNTLTGWTELLDENNTFGAHVWWRLADGNEGATVTFTCTGSSRAASVSYRISGAADPTTRAPEISAVGTGTSAAPNPNTVTPTGGAKDYLWITFFANGSTEEADDNTWLNNSATNYDSGTRLAITSGTGGTNVGAILGSCERTANAASEDAVWPASSTDTSAAWRAFTIAVHPAPPPTTTGTAKISLAAGSEPTSRTAHSIKVRARVTSGAGKIRAALYESSTNITDTAPGYLESSALTSSLADYTLAIADADAAAISSYGNLDIWLWGYAGSGSSIVFEVDQVWLEIPASSVGPKAVTPAAITGTSAVTAAAVRALHRIVPAAISGTSVVTTAAISALHRIVPAAISTTSAITAAIRRARGIVPAAISASSTVTAAAVRALHLQVPAAISTTSAITATIRRARAVVPAAISTTSDITAALTKQAGGGPKAVTPAAISTSSAVTAGVIAQHRIVPTAVTASSSVGALTLQAQRRVAPAAITASSAVTATVVAQHRIVPAAITATSAASAAVTKTTAGTTQTGAARISLAPGGFPTSRTLHSIELRARVTSGAGKIRAQLWHGVGQIGSGYIESAALTTSLADYTLAIPDADAATITDYSNLEIRFWGFCSAGGAIVFEVDQLWLELPATSPKAVAPAAITATSAVTAAVGKQAGPRVVAPAAITATSNVTAWIPQTAKAQGGLLLLWMHGAGVAKFVAPTAITSTSAVTASLRAARRVALAAITATSLITAAIRALKRITPSAINATSAVSASITKPGSGPRAVAPAAISTTSAITAAILRGRPVVPAAITASSSVTASSIAAKRAVTPTAITATSGASVSVQALHRIIPAAISSTSLASASVTKPGPGPKQVAPAAITSTSTITVSALRARRAVIPGAITSTSNISVSLQARYRVVVSAITSTSTVTAVVGRRITFGPASITATSNITAVIKGGLLLEEGVQIGFLGRAVGGFISSGRNGRIDEVELTPR